MCSKHSNLCLPVTCSILGRYRVIQCWDYSRGVREGGRGKGEQARFDRRTAGVGERRVDQRRGPSQEQESRQLEAGRQRKYVAIGRGCAGVRDKL